MTSASDNLAGLVDEMLLDAGCGQDTELWGALLSLGALASLPAPAPTGELAALLAAGSPSPVEDPSRAGQPGEHAAEVAAEDPTEQLAGQPDDELGLRRSRRRHRPTALGLVLVAGMGLGVGGVAASSTPSGSSAVEHLLEDWAPGSSTGGEPSAAGYGYRAPKVASDGEIAVAGSPAASGGAADAADLGARLPRDHAGTGAPGRAHTGTPLCAGPVNPGAGTGVCAAAAAGAASHGNGAGSGTEDPGAVAGGTAAGPGASGSAKAGLPASDTPPAATDAAGAAQKAAGPAANAAPAQGQTRSPGAGQGNVQKPASPAK
ncbi:hypothetical protein J7I84_10000 [Arthrobacter sp. ISL-85]|uniref:hypothetical protein n=1 Tax=Arthrobacter sp. ISL-85 TaxID=2819115 RepID=UPI001BE9DC89|nr:hypothetical protein [Arthrobacter sp. ISL-85]MBT2566819.1 hypothetical protein [Arthrobacter sp. ISL-85]